MDRVEEILNVLKNLQNVWHDDTELGYLIEMYTSYLNSSKKEK